jgi:hypothetical protein
MVDPERLELPTPAFEAQCSIQLSYGSNLFELNDFIVLQCCSFSSVVLFLVPPAVLVSGSNLPTASCRELGPK